MVARRSLAQIEKESVLIMRNNSLRRFDEGGPAIFVIQLINHHIDMVGKAVIIPFVRNILRVCVDSYVIFASANRLDEQRP